MATLAQLYGLSPAQPSFCRVLELGCSDGGNLMSMAVALPGSSFVGIDLAHSAIELGQQRLAELGLANVELRCADLLELPDQLGEFDFIVSHGVYSWVPEAVRAKLLSICRASLASNGVAFVSYNALPGGYLRKGARDLMRFEIADETDPERQIERAVTALSGIAGAVPKTLPFRAVLEHELNLLVSAGTSFVFHDALSPENQPFYFLDFCARAAEHELGFLTEAHFSESSEAARLNGVARSLPEGAYASLERAEQYLDFLKGRYFRQTLLVHRAALSRRRLDFERVASLFVRARLDAQASSEHAGAGNVESFQAAHGIRISTDNPVAKAALKALSEAHPRALAFQELLGAVLAQVGELAPEAPVRAELVQVLMHCYASDVLELRSEAPRLALGAGQRPLASPLARLQARVGEARVTNLRHALVELDDPEARQLLLLLDGSADRQQLAARLFPNALSDVPRDLAQARVAQLLEGLALRGLLLA